MKKMLHFAWALLGFVLLASNVYSQAFSACPAVDAGPDQSISCAVPCANLTATPVSGYAPTTYTVGQIPYNPFSYTAGTAVIVNQDDIWSGVINLPFNFCFYGISYNQAIIGANGAISFNVANANAYNTWPIGAPIPSATPADMLNSIMAPWHDIDPSVFQLFQSKSIRWQLIGTAPCRAFVVSWSNIPMYGSSCDQSTSLNATQQIVLYETTNIIETYIERKRLCTSWNGGAAIHGIQNATGTAATVVPGRNFPTQWTATNDAWQFLPAGAPTFTTTWFEVGNATPIGTTSTVNVCPSGTTNYVAQVVYTNCDNTTVTVRDTVQVTAASSVLQVVPTINDITCTGQQNGSISLAVSSGTPGYTFTWSPAAGNVSSISGLAAGNYSVTVTDNGGCSYTNSFIINQPAPLGAYISNSADVTCNGASDGFAVVSSTAGQAPFTYNWSTVPVQTTDSAFGLSAGTYFVTITDNNGCADTVSVTINEPSALGITFDLVQNVSCNGAIDGCIQITPTGGNGNYSLQWSNGATSDSICGLSPGTYVVTLTDTTFSNSFSPVFYQENFNGVHNWTLNVPTGANGIDNNFWVVNDNEGGVLPPGCGTALNGDKTLHITSVACPTCGAAYDAGGLCGTLFCPQTNMRAESPMISTIGGSNLVLEFNFISLGDALLDNASVWYNVGGGWIQLNPSIKSLSCISGQGQWTQFSAPLPATAWNIANLQVGINWTNNDDGIGTDPSVAIDNIRIFQPGNLVPNLCTFVDSVTIQEPAPLGATYAVTNLNCAGDSSGCIVANVTGGNGNYHFQWSTGDTLNTICNIPAGTYIVTITDTSSTSNFSAPTILYNEEFEGSHLWTLNVPTGVNGTDNNFWVVNDNEGGVLPPGCGVGLNGNRTMHITSVACPTCGAAYDAGGLCGILFCPETNMRAESPAISTVGFNNLTLEFDFISDGDALLDNASVWYNDGLGWTLLNPSIKSTPNCISGQGRWQNFTQSLPASTWGIPNLQIGINWTNNDDGIGSDPSIAINNVRVVAPGSLTSTPILCERIDTIEVTQPDPLLVGISGQDISCNGAADGYALVTISGGTPNYSVTWSNSMTGDSIGGLSGGIYLATIVDQNGCTDTISITLNEPPAIITATSMSQVICAGDSNGCAYVTASGGPSGVFTYTWSNGMTGDTICGLSAGTYYVTITDTTGGSGTQNIVVYNETFDPVPAWTLNVPTGVNGTDNNFWVINDNEGGVLPPGCGVASNGNRTLHITSVFCPTCGAAYDAGGLCGILFCPETNMRAESPAISTIGFNNLSLNFDMISLGDGLLDNASVWYNAGTGWNLLNPSIKSNPNCGNGQGQWTAMSLPLPPSTWNIANLQIGFNWTNNDDGIGADPSVAINNIQIVSSLTTTSAQSCFAVDSIVVTSPLPISSSITNTTAFCGQANGTATVVATGGNGGYSYSWSTIPSQTSATATNLLPGTYYVTIEDVLGCTSIDSTVIPDAAGPTISLSNTIDVSCNGLSNGEATVSTSGGTQPISVTWNTTPSQSGNTASGLAAGAYMAYATDSAGCIDSVQIIINQPNLLTVSINSVNAVCGLPTGSATATASGGTLNYSYAWSNGQSGANATNLGAGNYTVTVTDPNGCIATQTVAISQAGSPSLNLLTQTNVNCFGGNNGAATVNASGGTQPYSFQWNTVPVQNTAAASNLAAGTYTVTVTDANNCRDQLTVTITEPPLLTANVVTTPNGCLNSTPNGTAGATVQGGTAPYVYSWSTTPMQIGPFASGLLPGNYSVTVTDARGCQVVASGTVGQIPSPTVTAGPDQSFCEGEGGAMISAVGSGGTPGYYYSWWCATPPCGLDSVNDNDPLANPNSSQWYYVQVTDTNGCVSNVDSVFVTVLPKPIVDAGPDIILCGDSAPCQILTPTISNASGPYTYNWIPSAGLNNASILNPCARPDTTTIYTLVVTAGNGCTSDFTTTDTLSTVTVFVNPIPVADAGPDRDICLGDSIVLQGTATQAGPQYDFEWTPANGLSATTIANPSASPLITTDYTLVVWSNGCPSYADSVNVAVHTIPTVDAGWDREICPGVGTILDASAGGDSTASYTFNWWPTTGVNGSAQVEDLVAGPLFTTTYYVQALSNWGCLSPVDSATVYVIPAPFAEAGPDLFICPGDTAQLQASYWFSTPDSAPLSQIYHAWTPATTINDTTLLQPMVWPSQSMWYYLDTRYNVCHTHDSVLVSVGGVAQANILPDTNVICQRDSVLLDASSSLGSNFTWSPVDGLSDPNSLVPMAAPDSTTTYWLHIGEGACMDSMMFTINVLPRPIAAYLSSATEGCVPHTVSFIENSAGGTSYIWDFGDGSPVSNTQTPVHTFENAGLFNVSLTVSAPGGCADEISTINVIVADTAIAEFISDPAFPVEMSLPTTTVVFTDKSVNAGSWQWDFGDGIVSTDMNPSHTYATPGTYFVTLSVNNSEGCRSEVTHGPYIVAMPELFIPNVFSPNGDGINDEFIIQYTGDQPYLLQIFDRWGVLLSETRNKTKGWKGNNLKGEPVVDGIYYYIAKIGNREYSGNVTLVR